VTPDPVVAQPHVPSLAQLRSAKRHADALSQAAPPATHLRQRSSSSGTSWAHGSVPSLQFLRAATLLAACGMDVESVSSQDLSAWLDALRLTRALHGPVDEAAASAMSPTTYNGPLTLASFPVVAGLERPGEPCLLPAAVLAELRPAGRPSWRHAFAVALIGAPAELSGPPPVDGQTIVTQTA